MTTITKTPVEGLIEAIASKEAVRLRSDINSPSSQPYFYLSNIHSCQRHLYYLLTEGENRPPIDEHLAALFAEGKAQELRVKAELANDGFEMIRAQERIEVPYQGPVAALRGQIMAVGKIDGMIQYDGINIPVEVKAMNPNMYGRINSVDDLLDYDYTQKYVRQLLMYMYAKESEFGLFIISDFMGHRKRIPVFLGNHLEVAEAALRTMEKSWEAKASGQIPDRIAFHSKVCGRCPFQATCLPSESIGGADAVDDPALEALLTKHQELKAVAGEFKEVDEAVKDAFKNRPTTTVSGHYEVGFAVRKVKRLNKDLLTEDEVKRATEEKEERHLKIRDLTEAA